jgi:hypothetical protein
MSTTLTEQNMILGAASTPHTGREKDDWRNIKLYDKLGQKQKKGVRAHLFLHSSSTMPLRRFAVEHGEDKTT